MLPQVAGTLLRVLAELNKRHEQRAQAGKARPRPESELDKLRAARAAQDARRR
jgi:hypothetical protein